MIVECLLQNQILLHFSNTSINALFKLLATCEGEVGNFNFPIKSVSVQTPLREFI